MRALLLPWEERKPDTHSCCTAVKPESEGQMRFGRVKEGGEPHLLTGSSQHCRCRVQHLLTVAPLSLNQHQLPRYIHDETSRVSFQLRRRHTCCSSLTGFTIRATALSGFCLKVGQSYGNHTRRVNRES